MKEKNSWARLKSYPYSLHFADGDDGAGGGKPADGAKPADDKTPAPDDKTIGDKPAPKSTMLGDAPSGDEGKPADTKTGDEKKPADVPEKYTLSLPKDSPLDPTATDRISAFARENGLSQAQAEKAMGFLNSEVTSRDAAYLESIRPGGAEWIAKTEAWKKDAIADPEIGGSLPQLEANVATAQQIVTKYFPKEVLTFLKETGLGAHPGVIKGFVKMARAVSEGNAPKRDAAPPAADKKSGAQKLYPNLPSESGVRAS